ncbi:hypothetical protein [Microcoleus sp. LAD1_D3]
MLSFLASSLQILSGCPDFDRLVGRVSQQSIVLLLCFSDIATA